MMLLGPCTTGSSILLSPLTSTMTHFPSSVLDQEVGVVAAQGMGVRVDVLDVEVGLAVREHAGEVDLLHAAVAEQAPEEILLRD